MYSQPNTEQLEFRENLRALYPGAEIHHIWGRTAQVKIDLISTNIGHQAIIAVTPSIHSWIHSQSDRRPTEKRIWIEQMENYKAEYGSLPFSVEIYEAIRAYHK